MHLGNVPVASSHNSRQLIIIHITVRIGVCQNKLILKIDGFLLGLSSIQRATCFGTIESFRFEDKVNYEDARAILEDDI